MAKSESEEPSLRISITISGIGRVWIRKNQVFRSRNSVLDQTDELDRRIIDKRLVQTFYLGSYTGTILDRQVYIVYRHLVLDFGFLMNLLLSRLRPGPDRELIEGEQKFTYSFLHSIQSPLWSSWGFVHAHQYWHHHSHHSDVLPWSCPPMINPNLSHSYLILLHKNV